MNWKTKTKSITELLLLMAVKKIGKWKRRKMLKIILISENVYKFYSYLTKG